MRVALIVAATTIGLASCGKVDGSSNVTLYRSSPIDPTLRVHFGTFNARETDQAYNLNNCLMTSRLLNSNARALAERNKTETSFGFWCEPGEYRAKGSIPKDYQAAFPTDV